MGGAMHTRAWTELGTGKGALKYGKGVMSQDVMKYIMGGKAIEADPYGYLLNLNDWSEELANTIALGEDIQLLPAHWELIHFLRNHYRLYGESPNVVLLIKAFAKEYGEKKGNKESLYRLFPKGPARQGCLIAGLPLPTDCLDWPH